MSYNLSMPKLTPEKRLELRLRIRKLVEEMKLEVGIQSRLAEEFGVSRAYIYQIVADERLRFKQPVSWEIQKAKSRGRKGRVINFREIVEGLKDHPAMQTHN